MGRSVKVLFDVWFGLVVVRARDLLQLEGMHAHEQGEIMRCHETIAQMRLQMQQLEERAEFAEITVKGQNGTIANLWAGNDRLLQLVSDMRRLGFEMPRPTSNEPPDNIGSVADDDRDALKRDPTLAVRDD